MSVETDAWPQAWKHGTGEADSETLAARLQAGDPAALGEMAEEWSPRLYRYLLRYTSDGEAARDLAQETLVRALKALLGGTQPGHLPAWLLRIATNLARDRARSAYHQRVSLRDSFEGPDEPLSADSPERMLMEKSLAARPPWALGRPGGALAFL